MGVRAPQRNFRVWSIHHCVTFQLHYHISWLSFGEFSYTSRVFLLTFRIEHFLCNMSQVNKTKPFPLLQLPNELISAIAEQIEEQQTLRSLARTCRRVQPLTEPVLYRSFFHRNANQTRRLSEAIESRAERVQAILAIDSRCKWQQRKWLITLAPIIAQANNLRQLTIESPYCNRGLSGESNLWRKTICKLLRPVCQINEVNGIVIAPLPSLAQRMLFHPLIPK